MDALVTYSGNRVGYSAVRSLAELGIRVAVADIKSVGMSQWSRFCSKKYLIEHPYTDAEAFMDDVVGILGDSGASFLLPAQSETEVMAKYRDRLPDRVVLPLASYEQKKWRTTKTLWPPMQGP